MKTPSRRGHAAFTLIELMAVVTIIVILAGIVVGGMGFVNEKQAREKARVQIALLSKALEEYKLEMGSYPGTSINFGGGTATEIGGDYSKILYTALFYEGYQYTNPATPPDNWTNKATKIFLPELDPRNNKQGWVDTTTSTTPTANQYIRDPWGNPYLYRVGTLADGTSNKNAQNPDFDLWSKGKDGQTDTNNPAMSQSKNRDDVRNF